MKFILIFVGLLLAAANTAADVLGARVGVNYWYYDLSGSARYRSNNSADDIDINDDLGYNDDSSPTFYALFDHPLPAIPNVALTITKIDSDANGVLSRSVTFGGLTFTANEPVQSDFELDQYDLTLYYRVLDNWLNLDLGINGKYIDSKATINGAVTGSQTANVSGAVPMLYAGAGIDLPFTGLSVGASGSYIGYDGSRFFDFTVHATYTTPWFAGVDIGYRKLKLDLDDFDNSFADVEFDGPYAGAYLHF